MRTNIATTGTTPVQVGTIKPRTDEETELDPTVSEQPSTSVSVTNIQSGNAQVGVTAGVIVGDLHIAVAPR